MNGVGQNCRATFLKVTNSTSALGVGVLLNQTVERVGNESLSEPRKDQTISNAYAMPLEGPDERISSQDAIRAYTYNTAYANFEEKIKGSIEVGKLADLTVLSKNLLRIPSKEILTTEVVYTIVNGKIVYQRSGSSRR